MLVVSVVCARRCMCKCLHMRLCVSIWMFTRVSVCVCVYMCFSMQCVFATFLCVCLPVSVCHILCPARWQSAGHVVPQQGLKHSTHSQAHSYKFFINCSQLHCGQEVASHNKNCGECRCRESCFPQNDFNRGISFIFTQCWWIHQLCYSPCSLIISVLMLRKRRRKYAASALCSVFPNFLKNVSPPIDVSSVFPTALTSRHLYSNT